MLIVKRKIKEDTRIVADMDPVIVAEEIEAIIRPYFDELPEQLQNDLAMHFHALFLP
tara:strand:+ start:427 stop:597 length:171 start_codon:yes stop_codon:yes gene_type:complete